MLRGMPKYLAVLLLILGILSPAVCFAEEPVVDIYFVYSNTCPHCQVVKEEILPGIMEKYGDQINIMPLELSDRDSFAMALVLEAIYKVPEDQAGVPEMFVGNSVLIGSSSIRDYLDEEIQTYLKAGGFLLPTKEQLLAAIVWETPSPEEEVPTVSPIMETIKAPIWTPPPPGQPVSFETPSVAPAETMSATVNTTATVSAPRPTATPVVLESASATPVITETTPPPKHREVTATPTAPQPVLTATATPTMSQPASTATLSASPTVTDAVVMNLSVAKPIHMAYFFEIGCDECDRAKYALNYLQEDYPNLIIDSFDVVKQAGLAKWLGEKYGLSESELLITPVVFVGNDHLLESAINVNNLVPILNKYQGTGAEAVWEQWQAEQSEDTVAGLFKNISLPAVVGAGLIDGLNPCAFATIVFFIAYLAFVGRKGRDLVLTGIAFTLGVFIAYLLLGLGLLQVLQLIDIASWGRYFYILVAALCLILAILNISDFFKARRGKVEEMQIRLPISLRRQVHRIIREGSGVGAYVAVSFVTAFLVSLIELACTGQIYVVILSALSHPTLRGQAFGYLIIYNLAFIVPLVIVFLLAFFGISSGDLARVVERHTATVKLFTALLFLGLGLWLVLSLLPLFGVRVLGS